MAKGSSGFHYLTLMLLLMIGGGSAFADCHYLSLRGFKVSKNPDAFFWDKVQPLIALEPGRFYSLAPERITTVAIDGGKSSQLPGRSYYIPQHLISEDNSFSLWLMVVDPDDQTADDTMLPLTERRVSLDAKHFTMNRHRFSLNYQPFADSVAPRPNAMQFEFEIKRRTGICDLKSDQGIALDSEYRRRNEIKRLLDRVLHFDKPHLVGGREYHPYRKSKLKGLDRNKVMAKAKAIAGVNGKELIALGREILRLKGTEGHDDLWEEYRLLAYRLGGESIAVEYKQEGIAKQEYWPTLLAHQDWNETTEISDREILNQWSITLPARTIPKKPIQ